MGREKRAIVKVVMALPKSDKGIAIAPGETVGEYASRCFAALGK